MTEHGFKIDTDKLYTRFDFLLEYHALEGQCFSQIIEIEANTVLDRKFKFDINFQTKKEILGSKILPTFLDAIP